MSFRVDEKVFQKEHGMAMGRSVSLVICNFAMQHFEKVTLDAAKYEP
jgi:hypothetical protein